MPTRRRRADAQAPAPPTEENRPRPYVIVDFVFEQGLFSIAIENIGDRPAVGLSIAFDKTFHGAGGQVIPTMAIFEGIPFLAPRRRITTLLDSSAAYYARHEPTDITVTVTYSDSSGAAFKDAMRHDLAIYRDVRYPSAPRQEEP